MSSSTKELPCYMRELTMQGCLDLPNLVCNIPNFGPTIYSHKPIDHDDYIDVLFYVGSNTPLHINMKICFVYWA